jgi:L-seryl-tRNA(Ser) seleniumtransferase
MRLSSKWNRRSFLGGVGTLASLIVLSRRSLSWNQVGKKNTGLSGFGESGNLYEELGVTTVINAQGTMTTLGGSLVRPEVEVVMAQASWHFVSMPALEEAAGKRIAEMLKLPEGYSALLTSGAAAAIQSGLAGILTGDNESLIKQLPDLTGMKSEVIIQKSHRNPFDHQLRGTGVKLIEIETRDQLRAAVNDRTALMHFTNFANNAGQIKVDEWVKLAREYKLPCFNDAAADTPLVSHLWDYTNMGYDLVACCCRQASSRFTMMYGSSVSKSAGGSLNAI